MNDFADHLLYRLAQVRQNLGLEPVPLGHAEIRIADVLDSMALVEYLAILAEDCATDAATIERAVGWRFDTVAELAQAMHAAGLRLQVGVGAGERSGPTRSSPRQPQPAAEGLAKTDRASWLVATAVRLPDAVQTAATINPLLHRPPGWLEEHAGMLARRVWDDQDPVAAAVTAGRDCLAQADLNPRDVGALLVSAEAPPLLTGLAAALHHRLDLRPDAVALEVGGACTGFLAALWLARHLVAQANSILILAVEAPSRWLPLQPGSAGETAALFGDGAAAALVGARPLGKEAVPLDDVILGSDGSAGHLLRAEAAPAVGVTLHMDGRALAGKAVKVMAHAVRVLAERHGLTLDRVQGIVAHGGNGRLPALLARRLGLPTAMVWSATATLGNLGSASLPAAWVMQPPAVSGPVIWTAAGAGLTWAAALTGLGWD